ncbi:MAG: hypothetical protein GIKADHBN_00897 [Phycisphaerales bacterium]|nr:hypothetical protein [Phycisphaerales bacterium]MCK6476781.1 hypothetical protein [Phycisphaerales bacterium]
MRSARRQHLTAWLIVAPVTLVLLLLAMLVRKPALASSGSDVMSAVRPSIQTGHNR